MKKSNEPFGFKPRCWPYSQEEPIPGSPKCLLRGLLDVGLQTSVQGRVRHLAELAEVWSWASLLVIKDESWSHGRQTKAIRPDEMSLVEVHSAAYSVSVFSLELFHNRPSSRELQGRGWESGVLPCQKSITVWQDPGSSLISTWHQFWTNGQVCDAIGR